MEMFAQIHLAWTDGQSGENETDRTRLADEASPRGRTVRQSRGKTCENGVPADSSTEAGTTANDLFVVGSDRVRLDQRAAEVGRDDAGQ